MRSLQNGSCSIHPSFIPPPLPYPPIICPSPHAHEESLISQLSVSQTLRVQSSSSEQEDVQVEVTRLLVDCYFDIVRKNLQDAVPKAIMHFLVLFVQRGLQQRLIRCLYRSEPLPPLFS